MANSAVVGFLRAILSLDTAQFDSATTKASTKITGLSTEATRASTNLAKMLGGDRLLKQAADVQNALAQLATKGIKLTGDEAEMLLPKIDKAVKKLEAMGDSKGLLPGLKQTQTELKGIAAQGDKTALSLDKLGKVGKTLLTSLGIGLGVGAGVSFVKDVFDFADSIGDLALKMGVSTEAAQRFRYAARQSGADIENVTQAIVQMNNRLSEGNDSTVRALTAVGLRFDDVRAMKPEEAFRAIADAIGRLPDPMKQTAAAMDLFGKQGADLLPMIRENSLKAADGIRVMTDQTVENLKSAKQAWQNFWDGLVVITGNALAHLAAKPELPKLNFDSASGRLVAMQMTDAQLRGQLLNDLPKINSALTQMGTAAVPSADAALKAFNATNGKTIELIRNHKDGVVKLDEAYEKFKREALTGLTDSYRQQIDFAIRLYRETGRYVGLLDIQIGKTEDLLRLQKSYRLLTAPPNVIPIDRSSVIPGPNTGFSLNLPPSSSFDDQEKRRVQSLQQYINLLGVASNVLGQFGRSNSAAWQMGNQGIQTGINLLGQYVSAQMAATEAAKATQMSAVAASAAMAAATFGISLAVQGIMTEYTAMAQADEGFKKAKQELLDMGYAMEDIDRFLSSTSVKQQNRAIHEQLELAKQRSDDVTKSIEKLTTAAQTFGGVLPNALRASAQELRNNIKLTDQQRAAMDAMLQKPKWQDLQQQADQLGVSLDALGKGFQQSKLNDLADGYQNFFQTAIDMGGDAGGILAGMSDEIQALVDNAAKFGLKLPEFIRPMLEQMIKNGQLLDPKRVRAYIDQLMQSANLSDEQRKALQDLGPNATWEDLRAVAGQMGITLDTSDLTNTLKDLTNFGFDDIKSSQDKMVDYLKEIRDLLATQLQQPSVAVPRENLSAPSNTGRHGVSMPGFANGTGGLMYFGSGTPVMLHGWEAVFTAKQLGTVGTSVIQVPVYLDGRLITSSVLRHNPSVQKAYGAPS